MPTLDKPGHEALAHALARGASVREAHLEAGMNLERPWRLRKRVQRPEVVARVAELRWGRDAAELLAISDTLLDLSKRAADLASGVGMMAARSMLVEAARLKRDAIRSIAATALHLPPPPELSKEEWLAAFAPRP